MQASMTLPSFPTKFPLGRTVITCGVAQALAERDQAYQEWIVQSLKRHAQADWGEMGDEDKQTNDEALKSGKARLFSAYEKDGFGKIWIITEWDRSATTILFPEEY